MPAERALGFTLVEVLVALAVLAIALAAVMRALSQGIDMSASLRDHTVAEWIAQNRLALHQARQDWPAPDTTEGTSEMAGREWHWRETVATTPDPALERVEIEVRAAAQQETLARLVGFLPRPEGR